MVLDGKGKRGEKPSMASSTSVELIGGPLCGMNTKWPHPDTRAYLRGPTGHLEYVLEFDKKGPTGKALFIYGDNKMCCEHMPLPI